MNATTQTIVKVAGRRGVFSLHGPNADGSISVFGPVVWHEAKLRWIAAPGKHGFHAVPVSDVKEVRK